MTRFPAFLKRAGLTGAVALLLWPHPAALAQTTSARPLPVPTTGQSGFREMSPDETSIRLAPAAKSPNAAKPVFVSNPGLAAGDYDGDGWCDLFVCDVNGGSALFRNLGNWRFTNATATAGLELDGRSLYGAVFADVQGDGQLDLFVLSLTETNSLFLGHGKGRFTEARDFPWRRTSQGGEISAALADVDGDGDLDFYATSYAQRRYMDVIEPDVYRKMVSEQMERLRRGDPAEEKFAEVFEILPFTRGKELDYHLEERSLPHLFYWNEGGGRFAAATLAKTPFHDESGRPVLPPRDWGLGAAFHDVNGDGVPDLYACNDFLTPDRFWLNDGHGHFQPAMKLALRHASRFSMGVDFADVNRDGRPDFFTLDMRSRDHTRRIVQAGSVSPTPLVWGEWDNRPQHKQNALFVSRGDGSYVEIAQFAGVKASEWSWAAAFLDVDLDGFEDILVTTGMERDFMDVDVVARIRAMGELSDEQRQKTQLLYPPLNTPNLAFRNRGNLTFEEVGAQWGFRRGAVSGGLTLADFDNDGDLDVAINNLGSPPEIYRNESAAPRVAVRLRSRSLNTQGIGALVTLVNGAVPMQSAEVVCGGIYASGCDPLRVFACGDKTSGMELRVRWRNGRVSIVRDAKPNYMYEIHEP